MKQPRTLVSFLFVFLLAGPLLCDSGHEHKEGDPTKLGKVHFPVACRPESQKKFDVALAMLHSFWYSKAEKAFSEAAAGEPGCAMAHWGVAMSYFHQIWEAPPPDDLKAGLAAMAAARTAGAKTERERDYIEALGVYYDKSDSVDHLTRFLAYEKAMADLAAKYPKDREASIFYALTLNGVALAVPPDKTYARQKKAGAILGADLPADAAASRRRALHHPQLRLSDAGGPGPRRRAALLEDRPGLAARSSHAVAHFHENGPLGGLDTFEPRFGRSRPPRR